MRRMCSSMGPAESHSDFSRVVKAKSHASVEDRIRDHLTQSKVVLYMKGMPTEPACGFSWRTVQVLNALGAKYSAHNVLLDEELRQGIKSFSSWPTIPQVFIDGEFIGGCDIVESMARTGDLKDALVKAGAIQPPATAS